MAFKVINQTVIDVDSSGATQLQSASGQDIALYPDQNVWIKQGTKLIFEGTTPDDYEAKLQATTVTADRDLILPDESGTLATQSYVTSAVSGGSLADTDALPEGSSNLYLNGAGTTDDLTEGSSNLYYTDGRVDLRIASAELTDLADVDTSGVADTYVLTYDGLTNTWIASATASTYGTADFNTDFATKTTTNLTEGTNLYYTTARTNTDIDSRVTTSFVNALNVTAASVQADSVNLGTDTTGNYIATITGTTNEVEVTGSGTETAAVTIGLPNNVSITNDLVVGGDLTVNGTTVTVGASNLSVADSFIYLNDGDAIGPAGTTFTGTGVDDAAFYGYFTGSAVTTYYVRIDSTGTPDTFEWSKDNFATTVATGVAITGGEQLLDNNIKIKFDTTTGHTSGDVWSGTASPASLDTGWWTNRNTGATGVGYTHLGVFFDVSDDKFKFVSEYDPEPTGSINTGDASFTLGTVSATTFEGALTGNVTGQVSDISNHTTTNLTEGTNLYYTTSRANTDFDTRLSTKTTTNLTEGTNLYYTTSRANTDFDTRLGTKTTTNLTEGTNLYYTDARVQTKLGNISGHLLPDTDVTYDLGSSSFKWRDLYLSGTTINLGGATLSANGANLSLGSGAFDLAQNTTTDLTEGSNLYYTDARARAAISATGSISYNNTTGVISYTQPTNVSTFTNDSGYITSSGTATNFSSTTQNSQFNSIGVNTAASGAAGDIRATADVTAYYSSDEKLKENVVEIDNAINKVKQIRGVEFDWTQDYLEAKGGEDNYFVRKHDVGVIAQEIETVLPEVVGTREDGIKAVKYDRIVALLIQAVKEQQSEIDDLKSQIQIIQRGE